MTSEIAGESRLDGIARRAAKHAADLARRNLTIMRCRKSGWTLEALGSEFGISGERVRQIIKKQDRLDRMIEE